MSQNIKLKNVLTPKTTPIRKRTKLEPLKIPEMATSSFQASIFISPKYKIPMTKEIKSEINEKSIEEFDIKKSDFLLK